MSWIVLTEEEVKNRITSGEWGVLEKVGERTGARPKLPGIIVQVTDQIREAIEQNPANYLGPANTLPPGAIYHACTLARLALLGAQPTREGETNPRQREEREAWDYIRDIRSRTITFRDITPPLAASSGVVGGCPRLKF